ncbi:hypothetical protein Sjap_009323 [Stephania japonica]|uniref:ER membrane protein complex subunit 10 n=1 Tax=Stephania japonica TaxID=461633 RepID=A0AAP0PD71_9MAGN
MAISRTRKTSAIALLFFFLFVLIVSSAFESDELLHDDDEFGIEGGVRARAPPNPDRANPTRSPSRKRFSSSDQESDSKVQFSLEHAFGDSDFSSAGTFSARLKTWSHGGQTLTKLRFSRDGFTELEKETFKKLLKDDDFYQIRLPSNVLNPNGKEYVISSVKARCLTRENLDEHFVIHMDGVNVLAVNYGSPGTCHYPRLLKLPAKWSFNSYTVLKSGEQAPRAPVFTEEIFGGESGVGELEKQPEKSFWAKYWMYLVPLGLVVMNAMSQAMSIPEEQAGGQPGSQGQACYKVHREGFNSIGDMMLSS